MSQYDRKDRFFHRAKKESFAARSVYKLEEINERFGLIHRGHRVIDLGCSPGSWLQYLEAQVGERGLILGYDLVPPKVTVGPNIHTFVADAHQLTVARLEADLASSLGFTEVELARAQGALKVNALVSDMAPKTTGIRDADQAKSVGLVEAALALALSLLRLDGCFVAKVFQGRGFDPLLLELRKQFTEVRALKPEATRNGSREAFIIGRGLKQPAT